MAGKKKSKKTAAKKARTSKITRKKSAKKKAVRRKPAAKKSVPTRSRKVPTARTRAKRQTSGSAYPRSRNANVFSDADSQGLSTVESSDSESVGELLEEGNAFEAGVVSGVEQADDADEREVRPRQIPEDDVPEEYLDED
jgi:hypothetical protein